MLGRLNRAVLVAATGGVLQLGCVDTLFPEVEALPQTGTSGSSPELPAPSVTAGSTTAVETSATTGVADGGSTQTTSEASSTTGDGVVDAGCPACLVLVDGLKGGRGVAVDAGWVYWTDQDAGVVGRIEQGGGEMSILATGQSSPYDIAVVDGDVYWTNYTADGQIMRVATDGGPPTVWQESAYPRNLSLYGPDVYWSTYREDEGAIYRASRLVPGPAVTVVDLLGGIVDLVTSPEGIIFTAHLAIGGNFIVGPGDGGTVGIVPLDATNLEDFDVGVLAGAQSKPWGIALQGSALVWADSAVTVSTGGRILTIVGFGGQSSLVASGQTAPWGVAVDTQAAYWTDADEVKTAVLDGGEEVILAEQQNSARSIAVDDQFVFWVTRTRLLQRAKP